MQHGAYGLDGGAHGVGARSMAQLYPDPDDLKRAQDSIQNRLDHYADNLWVPSREEILAARQARPIPQPRT